MASQYDLLCTQVLDHIDETAEAEDGNCFVAIVHPPCQDHQQVQGVDDFLWKEFPKVYSRMIGNITRLYATDLLIDQFHL